MVFVKDKKSQCFTFTVPEEMSNSQENNRLTKKIFKTKKLGNVTSTGALKNTTHPQRYAHTQERPEKDTAQTRSKM